MFICYSTDVQILYEVTSLKCFLAINSQKLFQGFLFGTFFVQEVTLSVILKAIMHILNLSCNQLFNTKIHFYEFLLNFMVLLSIYRMHSSVLATMELEMLNRFLIKKYGVIRKI